ncbi:hypothetical protein ACFYOK_37405 [Microbispora bryophytorum]|uniref:hypothetical protein n=1 Tax=Microbispora bryophytorum TaxID=1460882 RepID=UPI0033E8C657
MTPAEEVVTLVGELRPLIEQLQELLPEPVEDATKGSSQSHKVTGSPAPWHQEAGPLLLTIHDGVRDLEADLRYHVTGHTRLRVQYETVGHRAGRTVRRVLKGEAPRGGSDANTAAALDAITRLVHGVPDDIARRARAQLDSWVRQAREVRDIGEAEKWIPIHVPKGALPPACPYCKTFSLRIAQESGRVRCFNARCRDEKGERPRGRIDKNRLDGSAMLVWSDGRTIYYGESA